MFDRPRCRDWCPLSTQQLRLRSLIQISGHNIVTEPVKCSVYYTLHTTLLAAPFYTSERLDVHSNVLWLEVDCPVMRKSSLRSVCVRVWEHRTAPDGTPDRTLFSWGVHFSGLVPLTRRSEKRLKENTLVFQLHGGFFTCADHILEPAEQSQLPCYGNGAPVGRSTPVPVTVAAGGPPNRDGIEKGTDTPTTPLASSPSSYRNELLHCDTNGSSPPIGNSINNNNNNRFFASSLLSVESSRVEKLSLSKSAVSPGGGSGSEKDGNSPRLPRTFGYRTGPVSSPSPTEPETTMKIRYLFMEFLKSEVRQSYDMGRLLAVQERQRQIKGEHESARTLTDRICMKSAYCLNLELFSNKHVIYRGAGNGTGFNRAGMGKQLSRLLYQEREPVDPEVLLKGQELRRHIEQARFRCRLLAQEKERIRGSIQQFRHKLNMVSDFNIERESTLMARYRAYGKEKEHLYQQKMAYASQKDTVRELKAKVLHARHRLMKELNEIFYVRKTSHGTYTINEVPLPNAESYTDATSALTLSVALGYVAHTVIICSSILNVPLRNPIKFDCSRSRIVDCIKIFPVTDREFPLHCRSSPAPNTLLYGVFLLNQNISQLKYCLSLSRGDPRATLANLQDIMAVPSFGEGSGGRSSADEPLQAVPSVFAASSVDLQMPIDFNRMNATTMAMRESQSSSRICRSVDNYTKKDPEQRKTRFSSDPILVQAQLQVSTFEGGKKF